MEIGKQLWQSCRRDDFEQGLCAGKWRMQPGAVHCQMETGGAKDALHGAIVRVGHQPQATIAAPARKFRAMFEHPASKPLPACLWRYAQPLKPAFAIAQVAELGDGYRFTTKLTHQERAIGRAEPLIPY